MLSKEQIYEAAKNGDFVNTDGDWCATRTPEQFKNFLENTFGLDVVECVETYNSTAIATMSDGLKIAWNGYCYYPE